MYIGQRWVFFVYKGRWAIICSRFVKNAIGNLVWITLCKSLDCPRCLSFYDTNSFNSEHSISFHLFLSSSVSSISALYFSKITSVQPLSCVPFYMTHRLWLWFSVHHQLEPFKFMSIELWCHPSISSLSPLSSCIQSFLPSYFKWVNLASGDQVLEL